MSDSDLILKGDGTPYATFEAAKAQRTRMGRSGLDTNVVQVDGGWALLKQEYEKPKQRIPIGRRNILSIEKGKLDPNYEYRVVNDEPGRIKMFRDAGWEVVERREGLHMGDSDVGTESQLGSLMTKVVGKDKIGYLMRIKKEFYKEDQEAKAAAIRQTESGLKSQHEKEGRYGAVKIGNRPQY